MKLEDQKVAKAEKENGNDNKININKLLYLFYL